MSDVTGRWIMRGVRDDEELVVDSPTRTGGWNVRFLVDVDPDDISREAYIDAHGRQVILQTIAAADLQAWIDQGVLVRPT